MAVRKINESTLTAIGNAIRSKTGGSTLINPEDMATEIDSISSGGQSGAKVISSGTINGSGTYYITVYVGKKMPRTDFIFNVWLTNGTQVHPPTTMDRIFTALQIICQKHFEAYDLSTDGTKNPVAQMTYPTWNDASNDYINRSPRGKLDFGCFTRQTTVAMEEMSGGTQIIRDGNGFSISSSKASAQYTYDSSLTYNWELLYIGRDEANDIVEVP